MKRSYWMIMVIIISLLAMNLFAQVQIYYEEFDEELGSWWIGFESGAADGIYSVDDSEYLSGPNSLMIEIYSGGSSSWHVQALDKIQLEQDKTYELTFLMVSDSEDTLDMHTMFSEDGGDWTTHFDQSFDLIPDQIKYGPYSWTCNQPDLNYDLKWQIGTHDYIVVWLDSIVVNEIEETGIGCCPDAPLSIPSDFTLEQNYPNPFNPSTTISYTLTENSNLTLNVYNLEGRLVRTLFNGPCNAGSSQVSWDGTDMNGQPVASGIYIYRLDAQGVTQDYSASNKMFLVK